MKQGTSHKSDDFQDGQKKMWAIQNLNLRLLPCVGRMPQRESAENRTFALLAGIFQGIFLC